MTKPLLDRSAYDHPEHFDDEIRNYKTSSRYVPTPLESLLYELSGHRCTICGAPWLEIHHIDELSEGGQTTYENLVVLCPNCHVRVHSNETPSKVELRHYKLKQEIAYELPILSRLSPEEKSLVKEVAEMPPERQMLFTKHLQQEIKAESPEAAIEKFRAEIGCFHLQESGIVSVDADSPISTSEGLIQVSLQIRITGKGVKWLRYLYSTGRVPPS